MAANQEAILERGASPHARNTAAELADASIAHVEPTYPTSTGMSMT